MRMRNPVKVSGDKTSKIIMAILRLIVFMVPLLLIVFLVFFNHYGHVALLYEPSWQTDSVYLQETWQNGPFLYIRLSDGHVYQASACKKELDHPMGNYISFTAIGLALSIGGQHISTPKIIHCGTLHMDGDFVLP